MLSAPAIKPLAIAGAAPRTTTNRIADSVSLNRRMARGNHAIDGMVCRPVMSEPNAERRMRLRDTTAPTSTPMMRANVYPTKARRIVMPIVVTLNIGGLTVPNFMIGISLIFLFSVGLGWLPSTGWEPWSDGIVNHLRHIAMPVLTLSAYYFGAFSIVFRAEQKDVARRLFVQVARAKGLSEWMVSFKHALPNAALPILTLFGSMLPVLIGGSIVVESVFDLPGMGRYAFEGLLRRDYNIVMATTTVSALVTMAGLFMADVSYTLVDPRIRLD